MKSDRPTVAWTTWYMHLYFIRYKLSNCQVDRNSFAILISGLFAAKRST